MSIWPGRPPGGENVRVAEREVPRSLSGPPNDTAFVNVTRPMLTVTRASKPNGSALLIIPGGSYLRVAIGIGGQRLADSFAAKGFTTFIMTYRLPADRWAARGDAPLQDAQRALRLIRARAGMLGYSPDRIGVMGFSAGGHLAARLTARQDIASYAPMDALDRLPLAPRVAALLCPVIALSGPHAHSVSGEQFLIGGVAAATLPSLSADAQIAPGTPPTFLAHALDDRVVLPENSIAMLAALRAAKVPAELHLLERGGHGMGLTVDGQPSPWPDLFVAFAKRHGLG